VGAPAVTRAARPALSVWPSSAATVRGGSSQPAIHSSISLVGEGPHCVLFEKHQLGFLGKSHSHSAVEQNLPTCSPHSLYWSPSHPMFAVISGFQMLRPYNSLNDNTLGWLGKPSTSVGNSGRALTRPCQPSHWGMFAGQRKSRISPRGRTTVYSQI